MPIYDYRCNECGRVSEIFVRSPASKAIRCLNCDSANLEGLVSASCLVRTESRAPGTTCCGSTQHSAETRDC